jgi:hypothetical protein
MRRLSVQADHAVATEVLCRKIPCQSHAAGVVMVRRAVLATLAAFAPAPAAALDIGPVRFSGEMRLRYESLQGQFRAGRTGGDQGFYARTLVLAEIDAGRLTFGAELQDSRAWGTDAGSPLTASLVNPADLLQAYVKLPTPDPFAAKGEAELMLGRMTLDIGSRRVMERVEFANVISNFTGAYWRTRRPGGHELHALVVVPLALRPLDRAGLDDNRPQGDEEEWGRLIWGVHYRHANALPGLAPGIWAEASLYGFRDADRADAPTPDRRWLQPNVRLFRPPAANRRWSFEVDAFHRSGARRATAAATDRRDLDVSAWKVHANVGYQFDAPWSPLIRLDWDYASGDEDPTDGAFEQYERLLGSRRTDLGNTGIHGPFQYQNINAPGGRVEVRPTSRLDARVAYKAAHLASARDGWAGAGVRDATGRSGTFIGHAFDWRARYWLARDRSRLEVGGALLLRGDVAKSAPNAARNGDSVYGYVQVTTTF